MTPKNLAARAAAIRIKVKDLAALAGLDEDNVHRILKLKVDPRHSSLVALDAALTEEEARLRDHLNGGAA